jgi:hypothetical protein
MVVVHGRTNTIWQSFLFPRPYALGSQPRRKLCFELRGFFSMYHGPSFSPTSPPIDAPRPYDAPDLTPRQFLEAVQRDPVVPLSLRIKAADHLLRIYGPPPPRRVVFNSDKDQTVTIVIETLFMDDGSTVAYSDMLFLKWCFENGRNPCCPHCYTAWHQETGYGDPKEALWFTEPEGHA